MKTYRKIISAITLGIIVSIFYSFSALPANSKKTASEAIEKVPSLGNGQELGSYRPLPPAGSSNPPRLTASVDLQGSFHRLEDIWDKTVVSEADLAYKKAMFQDHAVLKAVATRLKSLSFAAELTAEGQPEQTFFTSMDFLKSVPFDTEVIARQKYVKFLAQALNWSDNPASTTVRDLVCEIILEPNLPASLSIDRLKTLAGDKIELFAQLTLIDPARGQQLIDKSEGKTKTLLVWGKANYATQNNMFVRNLRK